MTTTTNKGNEYSADVRIQLTVSGHVLSIAQLGPDFIILRDRTNHPPAVGEIAMWIDDYERRWNVNLPDGLRADQDETRISYGE
jgi:hypothetical protein